MNEKTESVLLLRAVHKGEVNVYVIALSLTPLTTPIVRKLQFTVKYFSKKIIPKTVFQKFLRNFFQQVTEVRRILPEV